MTSDADEALGTNRGGALFCVLEHEQVSPQSGQDMGQIRSRREQQVNSEAEAFRSANFIIGRVFHFAASKTPC